MIYLAPLQGLTDLPFRTAYAKTFPGGLDYAVSPFISLTHGDETCSVKKLKEVIPERNPRALPLIPQILGNNPTHFLSLCRCLKDMGYQEVNWNLGCPVKKVAFKKRGSGLLPYPELINAFLEEVFASVQLEISLKIRLGYFSENEIFDLLPILQKYPVKSIMIHPRIGCQMYEGELYWDTLHQCIPLIQCPVIFNGDIRLVKDAQAVYTAFPEIKDVMIGRGLLVNPLLAGELKGELYTNKAQKTESFLMTLFEELIHFKGTERAALNKIKEVWSYTSLSFQYPEQVFDIIRIQETVPAMKKAIHTCFTDFSLSNSTYL